MGYFTLEPSHYYRRFGFSASGARPRRLNFLGRPNPAIYADFPALENRWKKVPLSEGSVLGLLLTVIYIVTCLYVINILFIMLLGPLAPLLPCNCPITSLKMPKALATPPNLIAHTAAQDIIKNNKLCQNITHIPIQPLNHHLVPRLAKVCSAALAEFLRGGPPVASRRDGAMTTSASKHENMLRY